MNVSKLRAKMSEERYNQRLLAKKIGMPTGTFSSKLSGKSEFKLSEAIAIAEALEIPPAEFHCFFM